MPAASQTTNNAVAAIVVHDLSVRYGDNVVLEHVDFSVSQGEVVALIGPNGSGKTTLLKTMLGLLRPSQGSVHLFDTDPHESRSLIGYVPQKFEFDRSFPITVREFLNLARHRHVPRSVIEKKIKEVELKPAILDEPVGELSGGQLQRVMIASAILNDPAVLFLDEPSTGIDVVGEEAIYGILDHLNRAHHTTIVLVSHDISMVSKLVDQVVCINRKMLCSGAPKTTLTKASLNALYGDHASHYQHHSHS